MISAKNDNSAASYEFQARVTEGRKFFPDARWMLLFLFFCLPTLGYVITGFSGAEELRV